MFCFSTLYSNYRGTRRFPAVHTDKSQVAVGLLPVVVLGALPLADGKLALDCHKARFFACSGFRFARVRALS